MLITIDINETSINIQDYTAIDISRTLDDININITNDAGDFAFNALFDSIAYHGTQTLPLPIKLTIASDNSSIVFDNITVNYHLNTDIEILHFTKKSDHSLI